MNLDSGNIRSVLVLMPDKHMGNLIVSLPAIISLQKFFQNKKFRLVVDGSYRDIMEAALGTEKILFYPRKRIRSGSLIQRAGFFLSFLKQLRSCSADLAIDLEGRDLSATLTFLTGAPIRVGISTTDRSYLYTEKVTPPAGRHRAYTYMELAAKVAGSNEMEPCRLKASEANKASLSNKLHNSGLDLQKPIVSIHPGAGKIYKQWTDEGFASVAGWLAARGFQVVFIGTGAEASQVRRISLLAHNSTYNLAGHLTLGELIALFGCSSLYIGNDSGPMHLAAASGAPVIGLFGHSDEKRWKPLSDNSLVLRGGKSCSRCDGEDCKHEFACIRSLSPDLVMDTVRQMLQIPFDCL